MTTNISRRQISGIALTIVMALGLFAMAGGTAQAQYRDYRYPQYGNRGYWPKDRTKDYAYKLAYMRSYTIGKSHAQRGYRVDYDDMPGYRDDDNGYLVWMGDKGTYRDHYRKGYKDGFKDAQERRARRYGRDDVERVLGARLKDVYGHDRYDRYDDYDPYYRDDRGHGHGRNDGRYGRYDRNQIYRIAQQNGYQDGNHHGLEDRNRRRGYDPDHSREYREAMRGYRSEYGDRNLYQQGYRDGYRRGYDDGYRRGTRSNTGNRWPWQR